MSDNEVTRIRVDDFEVGIVGLKAALQKAMSSWAERDEDYIESELLKLLSKSNYIPYSSKKKYSKAFLREFKKLRGDDVKDARGDFIDIKVLGPGCHQCDTLTKKVMNVLSEMRCPASVEHVTDINEIAQRGVFATPALMINGAIVSKGLTLSEKKIRDLLEQAE
ncbi:MAG: thioredoxin family protein [Desulfomonilaceae bacterium]